MSKFLDVLTYADKCILSVHQAICDRTADRGYTPYHWSRSVNMACAFTPLLMALGTIQSGTPFSSFNSDGTPSIGIILVLILSSNILLDCVVNNAKILARLKEWQCAVKNGNLMTPPNKEDFTIFFNPLMFTISLVLFALSLMILITGTFNLNPNSYMLVPLSTSLSVCLDAIVKYFMQCIPRVPRPGRQRSRVPMSGALGKI